MSSVFPIGETHPGKTGVFPDTPEASRKTGVAPASEASLEERLKALERRLAAIEKLIRPDAPVATGASAKPAPRTLPPRSHEVDHEIERLFGLPAVQLDDAVNDLLAQQQAQQDSLRHRAEHNIVAIEDMPPRPTAAQLPPPRLFRDPDSDDEYLGRWPNTYIPMKPTPGWPSLRR